MGAGPLKADKRKPVEVWEDDVFAHAALFTVTQFLGRGQHDRREFPVAQFPEALAAARAPTKNGKPFALYVVSDAGRSVCLERSKDEHWTALWRKHHATA